MTRDEYLSELRRRLAALPDDEVERTVAFYDEAIDDRMEAGDTEQLAVAGLETPEAAAARIVAELPAVPRAAAQLRDATIPGPWLAAIIVLLILGSPLWLTLLLAGAAVVVAGFAVLFTLLLVVWVFVGLLLLGAPLGALYLVAGAAVGSASAALAAGGLGLVLAGAGLLALHVALAVSKLIVRAIIWLAQKVVSLFSNGRIAAPTWRQAPMRPVWNIVHVVAVAMLGVGLVASTVGWGMAGFDRTRMAPELARANVQVNEWAAPYDTNFFTASDDDDGSGLILGWGGITDGSPVADEPAAAGSSASAAAPGTPESPATAR